MIDQDRWGKPVEISIPNGLKIRGWAATKPSISAKVSRTQTIIIKRPRINDILIPSKNKVSYHPNDGEWGYWMLFGVPKSWISSGHKVSLLSLRRSSST